MQCARPTYPSSKRGVVGPEVTCVGALARAKGAQCDISIELKLYAIQQSLFDAFQYILMLQNFKVLGLALKDLVRILSRLEHIYTRTGVHLRHLLRHLVGS